MTCQARATLAGNGVPDRGLGGAARTSRQQVNDAPAYLLETPVKCRLSRASIDKSAIESKQVSDGFNDQRQARDVTFGARRSTVRLRVGRRFDSARRLGVEAQVNGLGFTSLN